MKGSAVWSWGLHRYVAVALPAGEAEKVALPVAVNTGRSAEVVFIEVTCQWFAMCTRPAEGMVAHPVLGGVPTCTPCAAKHDLELVQSA